MVTRTNVSSSLRHQLPPSDTPQSLFERVEFETQQYRRRGNAFAYFLPGSNNKAQDTRVKADMARIDLDEGIRNIVHRSSDEVGETKQRREHGFGIGRLGNG